jgi:hypothetical protein
VRKLILSLSVVAVLIAAAPARAATMDRDLTIWGLAGYGHYGDAAGFGLGGRYQLVVAPQGILHAASVRDELGLEFGLDWAHYSWPYRGSDWTYNEVSPVVGLTWNFWLDDRLVLYPKLDVGFRFGSWSGNAYPYGHPGGYGGPTVEGALGLVFRADPRIALRLEAGSYALRFGLAFKI